LYCYICHNGILSCCRGGNHKTAIDGETLRLPKDKENRITIIPYEKFEDAKRVIGSRKSKDGQCNDQQDKQWYTKHDTEN
jgi:hypothetical protein